MNNLFYFWLSLSLSGSLVAIVLLLLKPLVHRFGKTWQYYLWLLVVLRLLVPFSPDVSMVGGLFERAQTQFSVQGTVPEHPPAPSSPDLVQPPAMPSPEISVPQEPHEAPATPTSLPLQNHIWGAIWLCVSISLLVRKIVGYLRFWHAVKQESTIITDGPLPAALQTVCVTMGIRRQIPLAANSLVRAPMLLGTIHPMIVLPTGNLPEAEALFVFRHEMTHYRRKDFLYKWLTEIAVCLHWFNPLAYWVRKQINEDCEFSCDEAVVAGLGNAERQTYGETLLNSIVAVSSGGRDIVSLSLNEDGKLIEKRLAGILRYRQKSKGMIFVATALTAVLLCGTVFAGAYTALVANTSTGESGTSQSQSMTNPAQTVVYEAVEMLRAEGDETFDFITSIRANHTTQKIVSCDRAMLAFDKNGTPLKLDWWARDDELNPNFLGQHGGYTREILPGQKEEQPGSWRLNARLDPQVSKVAYVLFCDTKITFEDGTVWENPNYEAWRSTYEGKKTDVAVLESYYPYAQEITFPDQQNFSASTLYEMGKDGTISIPFSISNLSEGSICLGQIPNLKNIKKIIYHVSAETGTGLFVGMKTERDLNQIGWYNYSQDVNHVDRTWDVSKGIGINRSYTGTYYLYVGTAETPLHQIQGTITLEYTTASS